MRVLIIAHNVIGETNNMGKTLLSYFHDFDPEQVGEFYIQNKEPKNAVVCHSYYRVTDQEALKSVFGKKTGMSFRIEESAPETATNNRGAIEAIRQYGRRRNAFVYTARNIVWTLAHWKTKELVSFLNQLNPDVIFFMSGDYGFMYKIALSIQRMLQKPLVVCCVDDYYLFNRNERSALGRYQHRVYLKTVHAVMEKASCILTISDSMGEAYRGLFNKPCYTLHTSAKKRETNQKNESSKIAYFGNLSFGRYEQLVEIGKAIKVLAINGIRGIDVYSNEKSLDCLRGLTEENGIYFHGEISASEVAERMDECMAIIHTESFDKRIDQMIRYSVSTKIADSLLNGPCLIAYGPEGIASIDYLKENNAAYVITKPEDLESGLEEILTNSEMRAQIVQNARALAAKNHSADVNPKKVRAWLEDIVHDNEDRKELR